MMLVDPYRFVASTPSVVSYIAQYSTSVAGSVATAAGVSFGTASANRLVVVSVYWLGPSPPTLLSATIGGIAASIATFTTAGPDIGGSYYKTALIAAIVPTGTSGTVAATFSSAPSGTTFWAFSATDISSATPYHVGIPQVGAVSVLTTAVDEAAGGAVFAAAANVSASLQAFTGVASQYSTSRAAGGSAATPTATIAAPISYTASGTTNRSLIAASFR